MYIYQKYVLHKELFKKIVVVITSNISAKSLGGWGALPPFFDYDFSSILS